MSYCSKHIKLCQKNQGRVDDVRTHLALKLGLEIPILNKT